MQQSFQMIPVAEAVSDLLEYVLCCGRSGCNLRLAPEGALARLVVIPVAAEPACVPVSMPAPPSILK